MSLWPRSGALLRSLAAAAALAAAGWLGSAAAQDLKPIPPASAHVVDETGTLDAIQQKALEDKLAAFEKAKGSQLAFLIVPTTQPEDIASYANRVGNAWKIGRKGVGDGVLLVVAKDDRKVRIEVAKTLEGAVPDLAAKQIIDSAITPNFRKGDYAGGLQAAADQLIARINGEALPPVPQDTASPLGMKGFNWQDLAIFMFLAVPVAGGIARRVMGRKAGTIAVGVVAGGVAFILTASLIVAVLAGGAALLFSLLSNFADTHRGTWTRSYTPGGGWVTGSGGGSSSSGGSSGGFSSGGGGDFGGGGASGDW